MKWYRIFLHDQYIDIQAKIVREDDEYGCVYFYSSLRANMDDVVAQFTIKNISGYMEITPDMRLLP